MALAGTGPLLGVVLAVSAGSLDPVGVASWLSVGNALVSWVPSNVTVLSVLPTALTAAGAVVTGSGSLAATNIPALGISLAAAAGSIDVVGVARWTAIAAALAGWMTTYGGINPALLVATPTGGPITGSALLTFSSVAVGPSLAAAAGSVDAVGIAAWTAIGLGILAHFIASATVLPGAFAGPTGGGPVIGIGLVS